MYSNRITSNPIDGLPTKETRKLTKEEKKALKQKKKEEAKRQKEEEKRKKEEQKRKEKEEKERKKEKRKSVKSQLDPQAISKSGSNYSLAEGATPPESPSGSASPKLSSSSSSTDRRRETLVRTKSGNSSGALGKVQARKGRRPLKFKEKEFQLILDNLRQNNKQDTELDLQNHYLDKWAAEELAEVLMENRTVLNLNLSHNQISDDGVIHIARMLEKNKTIHTLDISFNGLTRKGTRHIINCLNNNVFITELFMEEDTIELGDLGLGQAQLDAITPAMRDEIENLLESNRSFQLLLAGKSDKLELPGREQAQINKHIIDRFPGLRKIDLSNNKLVEIPKEIGTLKKLEELDLQKNKIKKIPIQIGELPCLEILQLNYNNLQEIPLAITILPRLRRLCLAYNKLENIPQYSIAGMVTLEYLDIRENPLSQLTGMGSEFKNIIKSGWDAIKFIRQQNEGSVQVYRMKLMFVGNGNVGKTTLMGNLAKTTKDEKSVGGMSSSAVPVARDKRADTFNTATDGIDIRLWSVKHPSQNDTIRFSCWDFAGQEVYYATHGFFLTKRAIYLLIFNLLESEEESQIEYWLQSINARTEDAPVLLVGTHAEDKTCSKEYQDRYFNSIYQKYGSRFKSQIFGHFAISNETQKGLIDLKSRILDLALAQPYMPDEIPLSFRGLEEKLGGAQQRLTSAGFPPTLAWEEYKRMALEVKIPEDSVMLATKFLNDLGTIVWFNDKGLRDTIIVDPQWITKTFATVVSLKTGFVKDGLLRYDDLPQLWKPPTYPSHLHPKLITMLEKFQVMCRLSATGDRLLIPCLLPDKTPPDNITHKHWPEHENIPQAGRTYSFEFVPLGFFSRLIVRFLATQSFTPLLYWKEGIVLAKDTERIKLSLRKNMQHKTMPWCLELWVRGPRPARHLTRLVQNIDTLVLDWLRVKFEVTVPCVHCVKEQSPDPYQFPLTLIEQAVSTNQSYVKCRGLKDVLVSALAPDVALSEFKGARVDYSDVQIIKQIGEGGFAKVYKAIWNGEVIALKQLTIDMSTTVESLGFEFEEAINPLDVFKEFRAEVLLMSDMVHPNIMAVKGLCMNPFCMLLEFCSLGSLYDYLHNKDKPVNWAVILKLAMDMAQGMQFMHNFQPPLIHRDLKSPNVLLNIAQTPAGYPSLVAKVADFGLSRSLMLAPQLTSKAVDNPVWLAPELMRKEEYDEKVDVYSFGVILWELVSRADFLGHITFLSAIEDAVLNGERPKIPDECFSLCPEYASLIERCWSGDSSERPSFSEVCKELEAMIENRLPAIGVQLPVMEIPSISEADLKQASTHNEQARSTQTMPSLKYRQGARANEPAPLPKQPSLPALGNSSNIVPPRTVQTTIPGNKPPVPLRPTSSQEGFSKPTLLASNSFSTGPPPPQLSTERTVSSRNKPELPPMPSVLDAGGAQPFEIGGGVLDKSFPLLAAPITSMAYLAGRVWTATSEGKAYIWDAKTCTSLGEIQMHNSSITKLLVVANKEVWSCSEDNTVKVWNAEGEYVADARAHHQVFCLVEVPGPREDTKAHSHVWGGSKEISMSKKSSTVRFEIGSINVWDAVSKRLKKTFKLAPPSQLAEILRMPPPQTLLYHSNHVWVASNPIILCFDPYTQVCKGYLDSKGEVKTMISVGKEIWSGTSTLIKVWNPQERGGDCVAILEGHNGDVLDFCTDGTYVWSCGWDKQVFLWDARAHHFVKNLSREHRDSISAVLQIPVEGTRLWSGGKDSVVCVWK